MGRGWSGSGRGSAENGVRGHEPIHRAAFLDAVRRGLGGSATEGSDETIRELATHLDDQVADAVAGGTARDEAERLAVGGMGDPERLGRDLARARRTTRRALVLAGYGALTYSFFSVAWLFVAWLVLALLAGLTVTIGGIVLSTGWPTAPRAYAGIAIGLIAAPWATRCTVSLVVSLAPWPARSVRIASALLILVAGLAIALLLPGRELDGTTAVLLPAVAILAALAALVAPARAVVGPGKPMLAVVAAVVLLPGLLWPAVQRTGPSEWTVDASRASRTYEATEALGIPFPSVDSYAAGEEDSGVDNGRLRATTFGIHYGDLAGWHDLAHEVWVATVDPDGSWRLGSAPILVAPFTVTPHEATTRFVMPTFRDRTWIVGVDVGTAPDGVRSQLGAANPDQTPPWRGSVLDWLLGS